MTWQPIETAPRDGSDFLGFWPDIFGNDGWDIQRTWFVDGDMAWETPSEVAYDGDNDAPTHWMPLPEPPTQET